MRRKRSQGFVAAIGIFMIAILVSTLAYIFEVGRILSAKIEAQNAADAGALAGAYVFAGLRNTMILENALMDLWMEVAENAAHNEANFFWAATGGVGFAPGRSFVRGAYQLADEDVGDYNNRNDLEFIRDMRRMYHRAFRVQDAAVTRFLAVHQTRVHQFRNGVGIYNAAQMRRELRNFVQQVVRMNLYRPGFTSDFPWLGLFFYPGQGPMDFDMGGFPNFYDITGFTPGFNVSTNPPNPAPSWVGDNNYQHNYQTEFNLDSLGRVYVRVQAPLQPSTILNLLPLNWFGNAGAIQTPLRMPFGGCAGSPQNASYLLFPGFVWRGGYMVTPQINPTAYALPGLLFTAPNKVCADAAAGVKKYTGGYLRLTDLHLYANFNLRYYGLGLPFADRKWTFWPWIAHYFDFMRQDLGDGLLTRLFFAGNPRIDNLEWYHAQLIPTVKTEYGPISNLEPYH